MNRLQNNAMNGDTRQTINIYYTAKTGKRNINGHTRTTGTVYKIGADADGMPALIRIDDYSFQGGGYPIYCKVLDACADICNQNGIRVTKNDIIIN